MSEQTKPIELSQFITAIKDISTENCQSVKSNLQNSISKLLETNGILNQEINQVTNTIQNLTPEQSHQDLKNDLLLYLESVDENNQVISNQKFRIFAINDELIERGQFSSADAEKEQTQLSKKIDKELEQFSKNSKLAVIYNLVKSTDSSGNEITEAPEPSSNDDIPPPSSIPLWQPTERETATEEEEGVFL
jgi:membrane-associated HD superfamily phosphohydrolase